MISPFGNVALEQVVRVADLRAYLLGKGWKIKAFKRPQVIYFEGPLDDDGRPLVLLIPAAEQLRDYPIRIEETINALSILESRPAEEILRNIITPTADILHFRLESPSTRTGTLELGFVEKFFSSMKDLLVFAACSQFEPRAFYPRALKQAVLFANKCRFRPAPLGSFRVDVEAPLPPPADDYQVEIGIYPIERLILTSLFEGLGDLRKAIDDGQTAASLTRPSPRINANMCEAILGMKPDTPDVIWGASVSWSPAWPAEGAALRRSVRFEDRSFERINAIARALRGGNKPRSSQLLGRVIRLSGRDPVNGEAGPLTVVMADETHNAPSKVEIILSPEQYRQAGEAHLNGRRIAVKGILDRVGRSWQLLDLSDFQVVGETAS